MMASVAISISHDRAQSRFLELDTRRKELDLARRSVASTAGQRHIRNFQLPNLA